MIRPAFQTAAALLFGGLAAHAQITTFDDLPLLPARDGATGLQFTTAPGDGSNYAGVLWDSRITVVGDQHRVDTATPGPVFGLPHSGNYFITNGDGGNGITLTTTKLLTGAWFGRNEYYGFGGGADSVTISALSGATVLASVSFALPEDHDGQPEPLSFVDTGSFSSLTGITGYRIDHTAPAPSLDNWVADDFQFIPVPEPALSALMTGLGVVGFAAWRRCRR
jgi:hypothetical protein